MVKQCKSTEEPPIASSLSQMQVYVSRQNTANYPWGWEEILLSPWKAAVSSCLQQDWAAPRVGMWVCNYSGNFPAVFLIGHARRPLLEFPREHTKDKRVLPSCLSPSEAVPPRAEQNACVQLLQQPWCVRPLHQASAPGPEDKDNSAAAKVFHVLPMLLKTACSPAWHTWMFSFFRSYR